MESFDDVIADAERIDEELEEAEPEPAKQLGSDEVSQAPDTSKGNADPGEGDAPKPRKKRISFV